MNKFLIPLFAIFILAFSGCNSDEPDSGDAGELLVILQQDGETISDYGDYSIAITHYEGWGYAGYMKDATWPIKIASGTYTISVSSPIISETETTETCYHGQSKYVTIQAGHTTEVTIPLSLTDFPKSEE